MIQKCKSIDCQSLVPSGHQFCSVCLSRLVSLSAVKPNNPEEDNRPFPTLDIKETLSSKYPAYYKDVSKIDEVDVYQICELFQVQDPSGALQHAIKKLLLSGQRNGGKTLEKDITEARDTLTRYLNIKRK